VCVDGSDVASPRSDDRRSGEGADTFEGTETMQTLIVGRDITGIGAFP